MHSPCLASLRPSTPLSPTQPTDREVLRCRAAAMWFSLALSLTLSHSNVKRKASSSLFRAPSKLCLLQAWEGSWDRYLTPCHSTQSCGDKSLPVPSHPTPGPLVNPVTLTDLEPQAKPSSSFMRPMAQPDTMMTGGKNIYTHDQTKASKASRQLTCGLRVFLSCLSWGSSEIRR